MHFDINNNMDLFEREKPRVELVDGDGAQIVYPHVCNDSLDAVEDWRDVLPQPLLQSGDFGRTQGLAVPRADRVCNTRIE